MNVTERLSRFLENRIPYMLETAGDAFEDREAGEIECGRCGCLAKSVAVNVDGRIFMVVIPAKERIDLPHLRKYLGADDVRLATEMEYRPFFYDCEAGAMPIFGSLYGVPVLVAHELTDNEEIAFPAGTQHDVIRLRLRDYLVTEKPCVCARNTILGKAS